VSEDPEPVLEQIVSLIDYARDNGQPAKELVITEKAFALLTEQVGHELNIVMGCRLKIAEEV